MGTYQENYSLKTYNTFGVETKAAIFISFTDTTQIINYLYKNKIENLPILVLGGGSNILFTSDFQGVVIHPENKNITIIDETSEYIYVKAEAGEIWDNFVLWAISKNYWGVENLSLIPGNTGAVPVQNIGAYGVEIKDVVEEVETIDISSLKTRIFKNIECEFDYRHSIFKSLLKDKIIVTAVIFKLSKKPKPVLHYGSIKEQINAKEELSVGAIRDLIISIRQRKLPDPKILGNAGSFFKNPIVEKGKANQILFEFPDMVYFPASEGFVKISAGWLIEKCRWKGKRSGDTGVFERQALVLVNYGNATGKDILELSEKIQASVKNKFGILLEREVQVI